MPRHRRGWAMGGGPGREERHSPLTIAMLEPALLVLLKQAPRHGYTLLADLAQLGIHTVHPSVVYRTLHELEKLEWIGSDWERGQGSQGPPRRTYRLTELGDAALQTWAGEMTRTRELITELLDRVSRPERS